MWGRVWAGKLAFMLIEDSKIRHHSVKLSSKQTAALAKLADKIAQSGVQLT